MSSSTATTVSSTGKGQLNRPAKYNRGRFNAKSAPRGRGGLAGRAPLKNLSKPPGLFPNGGMFVAAIEPEPEPQAAATSARQDSVGNKLCVICCHENDLFCLGDCAHPVCYECGTRIRVIGGRKECPICRKELARVSFFDCFCISFGSLISLL